MQDVKRWDWNNHNGDRALSLTWEVTEDDVQVVLGLHDIQLDATAVFEEQCDDAANERVEQAVLCYTDFDDQTDAAMSELEDILIEAKIIKGKKVFSLP